MAKELRFAIGGGLGCMLVLLLTLTQGCTKIPNGGVPIYLLVDSPTVAYDGGTFGSASYRIPDVWAESGSTDLGAYQMPVKIPILAGGNVPVLVSAGIYDNGIVSSRAAYPFYKSDTFTIPNAIAGQTYTYHPVYHYFPNTQFGINDPFENFVGFTNMTLSTRDADSSVYEGAHSGKITMGLNDTLITSIMTNTPTINTNGRDAYVEMNFKKGPGNDTLAFDVGIRATDAQGDINDYTLITIFPQTYWKKTYLNFSYWLGTNLNSTFQIYFTVYKNPGVTDAVYFDNVKLLYFN
jgi:hypothetical protein